MIPSVLSRNPPCPGSRSLVFFTCAFLFKNEIKRSPNWVLNEIKKVNNIYEQILTIINCSQNNGIKDNENINEPIDPDIVLLGLIFDNFLPLNIFPIVKPPISEAIETDKIKKI